MQISGTGRERDLGLFPNGWTGEVLQFVIEVWEELRLPKGARLEPRITKLLAGASWIAEYGDPDNPEDWAFLGPISAYHMVEAGRPYPPILIATTRRDDRVHPGHARKMAAKLQGLGYPAHYYEPAAGGHL